MVKGRYEGGGILNDVGNWREFCRLFPYQPPTHPLIPEADREIFIPFSSCKNYKTVKLGPDVVFVGGKIEKKKGKCLSNFSVHRLYYLCMRLSNMSTHMRSSRT